MDKEKIISWVERIKNAPIAERNVIVAEMAKQNSLKEKDVWKLLRENGFDPKATPQKNQQGDKQDTPQTDQKIDPQDISKSDQKIDPQDISKSDQKDDSKKLSVTLRHKTEYPQYRRAGLVLTQKAQTYNVTKEQLAALKKDPWVVICNDKKDGADE